VDKVTFTSIASILLDVFCWDITEFALG